MDGSVENVVQVIFSECTKDNNTNTVTVAEVISFITPFLQSNSSQLLELEDALKKNSDNSGVISRSLFMETFATWTAKYKDCTEQLEDSFDGMLPGRKSDVNEKSFVHSTPRTSLGILNQDAPLIQETLNISSASCPDIRLNKTVLEDRIKDLEYANWRLADNMRKRKAQEEFYEDQIDNLKRDLDLLTNKYNLTQKLIETFNKVESSKDESTEVETDEENSQIELGAKYKSLQRDYDLSKVEFAKQLDELEYEKVQYEKRNAHLENKICQLKTNIGTMESDILEKNNKLDVYKKENEALVATNNELIVNVSELTKIIENFKSQQKMMEGKLRKSLCYNDKLQTSFNALQAVKAIGEYSKSKQAQEISKIENKVTQEIGIVPFSPPFKSSKFSFYNINSPQIRKSPTKDKCNVSTKELPINKGDVHNLRISNNSDFLSITSTPATYVMHHSPPAEKQLASVNSSYDYSEVSCDEEAKFSHVEPKSPHMSLQTEIQEAFLCCCEETKQHSELQIALLEGEIRRQTQEKENLRQDITEYTKLVQSLENDKMRGVTAMRNLELEAQSLKQKSNLFTNFSANNRGVQLNQGKPTETFSKLKMKLEKYEHLLEAKQDELDNVKMSCEVYKTRVIENDGLINNLYMNDCSIAKLIHSMNEDIQSEAKMFLETSQDGISNNPRLLALLQSVIEESRNDPDDLSTEVLDFSKRVSCVTEMLRILVESGLQLKDTIVGIQINSNGPAAVNLHSLRFECDSPDSPSVDVQSFFNIENQHNSTVLAEADTKPDTSKLTNVNDSFNAEEEKMNTENVKIKIPTTDVATQASLDPKLRSNRVVLPTVGILLTIFYLLFENRTMQFRNDRSM